MKDCEVLIMAGSAGSLKVLLEVLPLLRSDLDFAIIIVLHRKPGADNILTDLLSLKSNGTVKEADEKEKIKPGVIYIAPSDYHLLIEKERTFSLDHSEKVNYSRPSIDVTFQSAAEVYRNQLVCILLSGSNSDGVAGLRRVKEEGGRAVIQNPDSATVSYMPAQAARKVAIDNILNPGEMVAFINQLPKI